MRPTSDTVKDHLGNEYASIRDMLKAHGVTSAVYYARRKAGRPLSEQLTPAEKFACEDHTGKIFPSRRAMAEAWNVPPDILDSRLSKGWPVEKALTQPVADRTVRDHLGNEYADRNAMARAYGLEPSTLAGRLRRGYSLEKALTAPVALNGTHGHMFHDHTGQEFRSLQAMCRKWDIKTITFQRRISHGASLEQALAKPPRQRPAKTPCRDHENTEYPSKKAMCGHYGIAVQTFRRRLANGLTLEQALTLPGGRPAVALRDWSGREYPSMTDMAGTLRVPRSSIAHFAGTDGKDRAAEYACSGNWPGTDAGNYRIRECLAFPWFLCENLDGPKDVPHAGEIVLHADEILSLKNERHSITEENKHV